MLVGVWATQVIKINHQRDENLKKKRSLTNKLFLQANILNELFI
jgi:hypothetical protein